MEKFDSNQYKSILEFGTRNLEVHCTEINELNVFPIPDGDTGTNMVLTLKNGLNAISAIPGSLPTLCSDFSDAVVLGARGNSGVITSQFFSGLSKILAENTEINVPCFIDAFENGVRSAYNAVAHPVEGTILTILMDSLNALKSEQTHLENFEQAIALICETSRKSLERTPELLPILKKAGVVDSGAAGMVYFFEGVLKYLNGETIVAETSLDAVYIDYSMYNKNSSFEFGFCTEILLQLLEAKEPFKYDEFKKNLKKLGGSIVISAQDDKIKIHIHTLFPESVMLYCHRFGEFLSLKIENMTVQHDHTSQKFLRAPESEDCSFSVIAVAQDRLMQKTLSEMGADIVLLSKETPPSEVFLDAFKLSYKKDIIVFPNSSNAVMSALQAASLYKDGNVTVLNSTSVAHCYSFLASMDFEQTDLLEINSNFEQAISEMTIIQLSKATRDMEFDNQAITKDDFFAYHEKEILGIDSSIDTLALKVIKKICSKADVSVISLFFGKAMSESKQLEISNVLKKKFKGIDVIAIPTEDSVCHITVSLE